VEQPSQVGTVPAQYPELHWILICGRAMALSALDLCRQPQQPRLVVMCRRCSLADRRVGMPDVGVVLAISRVVGASASLAAGVSPPP